MSKRSNTSALKIPLTKKSFKVFAVSFHGPDLLHMEKELTQQINLFGSGKKVLEVTVPDPVGVQTIASEAKRNIEIEKSIEKCRANFESDLKTHKTLLRDDLKEYWSGQLRKKEARLSRRSVVPVVHVEIIPKKITLADMELMFAEIEQLDGWTCQFFIVLFGKFSFNTINTLAMRNLPLQGIIHFVPCPEADLQINFPELYEEIDALNKSMVTKNLGIFIQSLQIPIEIKHHEGDKHHMKPQEIFHQFVTYLYDIEMLSQQFTVYQNEFMEINDKKPIVKVKPKDYTNEDEKNDEMVAEYLDTLYRVIEKRRDSTACYTNLKPFIKNNYGKIIIEEANKLLQMARASEMDMTTYWRVIDGFENSLITPALCLAEDVDEMQVPPYYELLSWESFVQELEYRKSFYDTWCSVNLSATSKLFILSRTLDRPIEVIKKYRLPTKLCFRDFNQYIAPDLGNILRKHKALEEAAQLNENDQYEQDDKSVQIQNKPLPPKFYGLTFDNTLQELTVTERIYRFKNGSIRCALENWLNKMPKLKIKLRYLHNHIFVYPWQLKLPTIRITTRNGVACNVQLTADSKAVNISIVWPSDCEIRYVNEDGAKAVEQRYYWKISTEIKRLFTPQGSVITYLPNDVIEVLTPNGVVYKLYHINYINNEPDDELRYYNPVHGDVDIKQELAFVKGLQIYGIHCVHFDVTLSDGRKLRVFNGIIIDEKCHYLIYEWKDYQENECYADRDDGVKMIWSVDGLKCYYPCGTVITSTAIEEPISVSVGCRSKSTELILQKINPALVERVASKAEKQDTYITYNMNYLMQHKNYASVSFCGEDKMEIYSPDNLKLILKDQNLVLIDIEEMLSLQINAGVCTMVSGATVPYDKQIYVKLNFASDGMDIVSLHNNYAFLTVDPNGEMVLSRRNSGLPETQEKSYLVAEENAFGVALMTEEQYQGVTSIFKGKTYFYDSETKTVLLKPVLPIDEQFSMPMPDLEKNLDKFKAVCNKTTQPTLKMERMLTARVIHKFETIPNSFCNLTKSVTFNHTTLENHIAEALDFFFVVKVKSKYSPKWAHKIKQVTHDINVRREKMRAFTTLLYQNIIPKYDEFRKCNGDLKLLNTKKLVQRSRRK